jgi:hypothetical protein
MTGYVGVNGIYEKLGKRNTKGSMVRPRWNPEAEKRVFLLFRCF